MTNNCRKHFEITRAPNVFPFLESEPECTRMQETQVCRRMQVANAWKGEPQLGKFLDWKLFLNVWGPRNNKLSQVTAYFHLLHGTIHCKRLGSSGNHACNVISWQIIELPLNYLYTTWTDCVLTKSVGLNLYGQRTLLLTWEVYCLFLNRKYSNMSSRFRSRAFEAVSGYRKIVREIDMIH